MTHVIDAKNKKLGRLASEIALALQGKKSAFYNPRLLGDKVIVKNIKDVDISESKMTQKTYYRHTGYMGHLKERSLREWWEKSSADLLKLVVSRMLPKNSLRPKRLKQLVIE